MYEEDEASVEEEFSNYLKKPIESSDNHVNPIPSFAQNKSEDEVFEDVPQEVIKNEE